VGDRIFLDGEDVTEAVRSSEVTAVTRYAADNPQVREHLVELQRTLAAEDNIVTEGRDQGTVVFPHAECKVFLTASPEECARRRLRDLQSQGEPVTLDQVLGAQERRDWEDASSTRNLATEANRERLARCLKPTRKSATRIHLVGPIGQDESGKKR
jgi:CMP/dCMP kinase